MRTFILQPSRSQHGGVVSILATYPERLTAVIAAKDASTVNTYVNEIFLYLIFNTFVKIHKNMLPLCHYGVLCVDL